VIRYPVSIILRLRQNIIDEHIKHRPGTRPWSWWHLEDRELRREGESEASYLKRLRLLLPVEKAAEGRFGAETG
jgi:hypothetical protein